MPKRAMVASLLTTAALILLISFKTPAPTTFGTGGNAPVVIPSTAAGATGQPGASSPAGVTGTKGSYTGQITGSAVQIPFGTVQVQVTFQAGKITDVQAIQMPSNQRHSAEISSAVAPMLHDEVLQAQSAQVNTISGATYTSQGYIQSLQSALDQAATA